MSAPDSAFETMQWLVQEGRFEAARGLAGAVLQAEQSLSIERADALASVFYRSYGFREAAFLAERVLEGRPGSPEALFNAARCLNLVGRTPEAIELLRSILTKRPDDLGVGLELAVNLKIAGSLEEAKSRLLELRPRLSEGSGDGQVLEFYLSEYLLREGRFREGLEKHLRLGRSLRRLGQAFELPFPRLEPGMRLRGLRVLIAAEGGQGDELLNARFANALRKEGAEVVWWTRRSSLASLLARVEGISTVLTGESPADRRFDAWVPALDLPWVLGLDAGELFERPYIHPLAEQVAKWADRVRDKRRLRVGLRWQDHAGGPLDWVRVLPFGAFEPLTRIEGADFYSIHQHPGSGPLPEGSPVVDWASQFRSWEDTAGALANLDLLITSDTGVAHLAGAMGKPVLMFCPTHCYYPWLLPGSRTPWYRDFSLLRQSRFGSWSSELETAGSWVRSLSSNRPAS